MGGSRDIYGRQQKYIQGFCVETQRSLRIPRYRRENNIKIDQEDGDGVDWIHLAKDRGQVL
jgi:hypothetical protein